MVLTRTINVAKRSTVVPSWEGVDRAHKINESPGPEPPSVLLGTIENHPEADETKKQWLKNAPQVRQVSRSRYGIVESWMFAASHSLTLYGGDSDTAVYGGTTAE